MAQFIPDNHHIIGEIKKQLKHFINNCSCLSEFHRFEVIKELGDNFIDNRFDASQFIESAVGYYAHLYSQQVFEEQEFWKQVAINSANVSPTPYVIANEAVEEFKKRYVK